MFDKKQGIVMANGVVLKDSQHKFSADSNLVSGSLAHVAKISKGLYSGICNDDPEFVEFQEESMRSLLEKETKKLCESVVVGADKQLARVLQVQSAELGTSYKFGGKRYSEEVKEIQMEEDYNPVKDKTKRPTHIGRMQEIVKETGDELASFKIGDLEYVQDINKVSKEVAKIRDKMMEKARKKRKNAKKKTIVNKVAKKKATKKKTKKVGKKNV